MLISAASVDSLENVLYLLQVFGRSQLSRFLEEAYTHRPQRVLRHFFLAEKLQLNTSRWAHHGFVDTARSSYEGLALLRDIGLVESVRPIASELPVEPDLAALQLRAELGLL